MNKNFLRFVLFFLVAAGIALAVFYRDQFSAQGLESWIKDAGAAGPVLFVMSYAVATIFFLPGSILTLAGGALFGPLWGTLYSLTGATLGATIAFMIARYLASEWVAQKTGGRVKQLKEGVEEEGWRFVAFVRLVPLFPFNVLNYALGLTRIKLSHYVIASFVCMAPGGFAYTYLGYAGREAIAGGEGLIQKILMAIALLALVVFIPRLVSNLRKKPMLSVDDLKEAIDKQNEIKLIDVRTAEEFSGEQGHIHGAKNIPLEAFPEYIKSLHGDEGKHILTICRTDRRSAKAAQLLERQGFTNVHVVKGGMTQWIGRGYLVER